MHSFVDSPSHHGWSRGVREEHIQAIRSVMINNVRFMQQNRALGHTQSQECDPRKSEYESVLVACSGARRRRARRGAPFSENGASMRNTSPGLRPTEAPFTENGTPAANAVPSIRLLPGPGRARPRQAVARTTIGGVRPPRCGVAAVQWSRSRRRPERD